MKKINLILFIVLTAAPLTALAEQEIETPPVFVFVQATGLDEEVMKLNSVTEAIKAASAPLGQIHQWQQESASLRERLTVAEEKLKTSVDQSDLDNTREFLKAASAEIASLKTSLKDRDDQIEQLKKTDRR